MTTKTYLIYRLAYAILAAALLVSLLRDAAARDASDLFPRSVSLVPVPPPALLLPALRAFHADTAALNPSPQMVDDEDEARELLVAARALPTPWGFGSCSYGAIALSDATAWAADGRGGFSKSMRLSYSYSCSDGASAASGSAHDGATMVAAAGCADVDDELRPAGGKFTTPYAPMACAHRPRVDRPPCCEDGYGRGPMTAGNPINFALGRKVQVETDYEQPADARLDFKRYYEVRTATPYLPSKVGRDWSHSFDRALIDGGAAIAAGAATVGVSEPSGHWTWFRPQGAILVATHDSADTLSRTADGGWRRRKPNDSVEAYDAEGRNTRLETREGRFLALTYDARDRLARVEDEFGRGLAFSYGANGHLSRVALPDGGALAYDYSADGRLLDVRLPGGAIRKYSYDAAARLTGIVDENGAAYLRIAYNSYGKAIETALAGGVGRYAYGALGADGGPLSVGAEGAAGAFDLVTPLGETLRFATVNVNGSARPASLSAPCPECGVDGSAFAYDAAGRVLSRADFAGGKACYAYSSRGLETARVEGAPAAASCAAALASPPAGATKVSTAWHPVWRLAVRVAEPGRITSYAYNGDGGVYCAPASATGALCRESARATADATGRLGFAAAQVGAAAAWHYTRDALGRELTATDPGGRVTSTSYAGGDVASVTLPGGETIRVNSRDGAGRPRSMTDATGAVTISYWPRGWPRAIVDADGATNFEYDRAGQIAKVRRPDGTFLLYAHDAAHRLTQVSDETGRRIVYTPDAAGDLVKAEVFDALGAPVARRYAAMGDRRQIKFAWHGLWCGPDWTGGLKAEYGQIGMWDDVLPPRDALDKCCMVHDVCYWKCRCDHGCSETRRFDCMLKCDREFSPCAEAAGFKKNSVMWWKFTYTNPSKEPDQPNCYGRKD